MKRMRICYFGDFNPDYIRNDVIIQGLRENGVEVLLCQAEIKDSLKHLKLLREYLPISRKVDVIVVGASDTSRWVVLLAKLISRKFLVWDAHYSIYDAFVFDKKLVRPGTLKSFYYWFLDWMGCKLADRILLDTNCHIDYFSKEFKTAKEKFIRVIVGANEEFLRGNLAKTTLFPGPTNSCFLVGFHGKFIPLQGVQYIVGAAKILEKYPDIKFNILGRGQMHDAMLALAKKLQVRNINFIDRVPYDKIPDFIWKLDVSLGIFGDSDKAARVIPNKLYESIALGKPVITADTPGIRELFEDRKNILLCKRSNSENLAAKILELKNDKGLRDRVGMGGYELFKRLCTPAVVGKKLLEDIQAVYGK